MSEEKNTTGEEINAQELETIETPPAIETGESSTAAVSEAGQLKDQLLRTMADFENYKRRTQKEFGQIVQNANEKLIVEILPVIDDMERALKASKEISTDDPKIQQFVQGLEFIYKKMTKALQDKGLRAMDSVNTVLDPELHDALMIVDVPEKESNTIVEEHEKGYYLYDKVIRHAKVIVNK
jgi:molecular chaperone GrpE